jgi:hypothetical protein
MRWSRWLVVIAIAVLSTAAVGAAKPKPIEVTVRIYSTIGAGAWLDAALAQANRTMSGVAVYADWIDCGGGAVSPAARCAVPLVDGELEVRIVNAPRPARGDEVPLGNSIVNRGKDTGTLATVYLDRILALAQASRTDPKRLLGRAIAHELGHLLMGSTRHDAEGLMRKLWTTSELVRADPRDWSFTPGDAAAIRRRALFDAAPRQARSLPQSLSVSSGVDGSGTEWSDTAD